MKNGIIINGKAYKAVRTNNIAGLGPDPCSLCAKEVKRKCQPKGYADIQPCNVFSRGYMLAHFEKVNDDSYKSSNK